MATLGLVWSRKVGTVRPRTDIRGDTHNPAEKSSGSATRAYKLRYIHRFIDSGVFADTRRRGERDMGNNLTSSTPQRGRIHPLVAGAAMAVIPASATAIAAMTGILPTSRQRSRLRRLLCRSPGKSPECGRSTASRHPATRHAVGSARTAPYPSSP